MGLQPGVSQYQSLAIPEQSLPLDTSVLGTEYTFVTPQYQLVGAMLLLVWAHSTIRTTCLLTTNY